MQCRFKSSLRVLIAAFFAAVTLVSCALTEKSKIHHKTSVYSGVSGGIKANTKTIDSPATREIYFILPQPEECIQIGIAAKNLSEDSPYIKKTERIYFIVEKAIDISRFNIKGRQFEFSEISRNFDNSWAPKNNVLICSSGSDPIKKLDSSVYRIRFTSFTKDMYAFDIRIISDRAKAVFYDRFPDEKK